MTRKETTVATPYEASDVVRWRGGSAIRLALKVLLLGAVCHVSTQIGFAHKFPPHYISPLWPTSAILFCVLVVTPVRQWWVYVIAAYASSVVNDARAGFPISAILFIAAGIMEILLAAVGVRRLAHGLRAFDSLRNLVAYLVIAVLLAPCVSAFIAAFAGARENYWFFWRVWFLSEALAYLMLAPAILTWIGMARTTFRDVVVGRCIESCLVGCVLLAISVRAFNWPATAEIRGPALVYLPLPILLWAAVRFGPRGAATSLLLVACLSISGAVHGRGPFTAGTPAENVLSLQLFLITASVPLMLLATLIEERRQRTIALSESEARFRSMADTAPVMIWMADPDMRCSYFSQRWLDFTGRTMEQELGVGWADGVHPEDRQHCLNTFETAFDARLPFEMEYRLRRHDGQYRWILDHGIPRSAPDGSFAGYIGSCLDIAERKRAELQLQEQRQELTHLSRVAILGQLSGALAHELNQPLTAILSNAQAAQRFLAQDPVDLTEVRDILVDIVNDDQRASEVIRGLRALLRKGESQFQSLDINEITSEVVDLARAEFVSRSVIVRSELAPALPSVLGDRVQLQQVLLNLIVNACDSMTASQPPERTLSIVTKPDGNGIVQVSIVDCGSGIPAESQERLFEPFFTTKEDGLGLGLAICRSIIAAHGGRLWAVNNRLRGATFCLALPVQAGGRS